MSGIFKAYDIRGPFGGKEWNTDTAYAIGRHLPDVLQTKRFILGRDCRASSELIRDALVKGLLASGAVVDDLGLATTPMVYYHTFTGSYGASVQITASHNPPGDNGLKISRALAVPVGYDSGLAELEARVASRRLPAECSGGRLCCIEGLAPFVHWLKGRKRDFGRLRFAVDCSDGMASLLVRELFGEGAILLGDRPDGAFPHHPPNPLVPANCKALGDCVRSNGLDLGLVFDGDADRIVAVDEKGDFVQPDYLIPYLADALPEAQKGDTVLCDIRTSRAATERLEEHGFVPCLWKVGHAYAKRRLRELDAPLGGELAGHYYFKPFGFCDSGELAALTILESARRAKESGLTFSQWLAPVRERYATSGECNLAIANKQSAQVVAETALVRLLGTPSSRLYFDGVRLDWSDGWASVRPSNTEPWLRVILEAKDETLLRQMHECVDSALEDYLEPHDPTA